MNFKQIDESRKILGLGEEASMEEIRESFRILALKYHPDACRKKDKKYCESMFKKISHAHDIIESYCAQYRYSFRQQDIKSDAMSSEENDHLKRFYDDWFGGLDL